jgi:hypothetical protein
MPTMTHGPGTILCRIAHIDKRAPNWGARLRAARRPDLQACGFLLLTPQTKVSNLDHLFLSP